ncbi:FKBP-type peptidyl-prolyl cis-trans isomerase [Brumimicrobium oceani]|uniref:Peptidyl-prolyl cis-trans isomerase n=1 Tax=Brumimicrobium oceani TaxID=2100725 RepID=A0A2U2XH16_9FLAO|nr:FKBP-type peptidyl-prolyl cis-trans isomerase [Brumimicrobium oceani]PWH87089.1 peptidylprolyl isomerase [Brumimicrobium oceani]
MKKILLLASLGMLVFTTSCEKSLSTEEQFDEDIKEIEEYISKNKLDAVRSSTGLYYVINELGTGHHPEANDNVRVRYKGYTTDGAVFDQSDEDGISFNLQGVIKGWTEGIQYFKEGGKGVLLIPSKLGYGESGSGPIAPNTVLVFDVELLTIVE